MTMTKRVDECDEDRVPPTITLTKDKPTSFLIQEQDVQCFEDNTVASDDCVPFDGLTKASRNVNRAVDGSESVDIRCS